MNTTSQHPDDLLAFYVNGTLTDNEQREVEAHIATCERCQQELVLLRTMRDVSRQQSSEFPREFAWQRLKRDLKRESVSSTPKSKTWWQPAVGIAAAVIIAVQAVTIINLNDEVDTYTQAGYQHGGVVVQIKINPQATEAQLRELLLDIDAEIVAGPSANGLYRVKLSAKKDDPSVTGKLETLKDNSKLITYVAGE